jgi:hypothetical protein
MQVSSWYTSLGNYTFPTIFVHLTPAEIAALVAGEQTSRTVKGVVRKLQRAVKTLPGSSFVHADVCAPTDAPLFSDARGRVTSGRRAWEMVIASEKVREAFEQGLTERLALHPYRRMNPEREFRMFVKGRRLLGMSQRWLENYHASLHRNADEIWHKAGELAADIAPFLPAADVVADVYLTSVGDYLLIDLNSWGPPTDPLLMRNWDRDWDAEVGLRLVPKPIVLRGNVEVSF